MSLFQPLPAHWTRPFARHFHRAVLMAAGLAICLGSSACSSTEKDPGVVDAATHKESLRQEAARAESQRVERLKLQGGPGAAEPQGTTGEGGKSTEAPKKASAASRSKTKLERAKELSGEIEKAVRELYLAELEQQLAKEQAAHGSLKSEDDLAKATFELTKAEQELARYKRVDSPVLIGKQQLELDQLSFRLEEATQNLDQMREEYAKFETDSIAKRTGEIVIWRAEKKLDFAKREVGLAKLEERTLTRTTIPEKLEALEQEVKGKQNALREATEANQRLELENKLRLTKAANEVVYKQLALDALREEEAAL